MSKTSNKAVPTMSSIVSSVRSTSPTSTSENLSEHWTRTCTIHIAFSFPLCNEILLIATKNSDCVGENRLHYGKNKSIALACENLYNGDVQCTPSSRNRQYQHLQKVCHEHCRMRITLLSDNYHLEGVGTVCTRFIFSHLQEAQRYLRRTAVKNDKKSPLNSRLRDAREEHGWSQQELADQVGTTSVNISRWENGITFPNPHSRQRLCEVLGKTPVELGLIPPSSSGTRIGDIPIVRNPYF